MQTNELSFVVQGPIEHSLLKSSGKPVTQSCLEGLRRWHPGAEIILSTWPDANVDGLDYDKLVISEDPGAPNFMRPGSKEALYSNGNRQIVSTANGLKHVRTRYAAKVRSDFVISGNNWLRMYDRFPERSSEWLIFKQRVITSRLFTRDPLRGVRKPFHASDWFMFGLTEDLLLLWDIPLEPEPESARWFGSRPYPRGSENKEDMRRYLAEQYVWKTLLEKFGTVTFDSFGDASRENVRLTQLIFANNLIVLNKDQFPFEMQKYQNAPRSWTYVCMSHREWHRLYRHYCLGERAGAFISRMTDARYLLEGGYCLLPNALRARASKFFNGRQSVEAGPLKRSLS